MLCRLLTATSLLATSLLAAGCSCNDQGFTPFFYNDLADDYGKWLSMDVAPDGRPVIAYYNVTMGALGFAVGDIQPDGTAQWNHEKVDGYADSTGLDTGDVGQWCSMVVAPDGTVWIAYYGNGALRVAHRVDGKWLPWEIADAGSGLAPKVGQWTSIALDSQYRPVVAHHDAASGTLRVSRQLDGSWTTEVAAEGDAWSGVDAEGAPIEREASVGMYARLVIHEDTEYIAHFDAAHQRLVLTQGFTGAYTDTIVHEIEGGNVGHWPSLWTDGTATALAFEDRANGDLVFAERSGGGAFSTEIVDADEYVGADTEIFQREGEFAVLYFDGRYNDMKLATKDDSGWATEQLGGEDAAVGFFNEVVETRGIQYVASYDYTNRHLFFRPL